MPAPNHACIISFISRTSISTNDNSTISHKHKQNRLPANNAISSSTTEMVNHGGGIRPTNKKLPISPKVNHLLYTIAKCLPVICEAQKCTCFLVDDDKDQLWVVQGEVNMRVPKNKGIAGAVATSGHVSERNPRGLP